jgi:hypothetical protein
MLSESRLHDEKNGGEYVRVQLGPDFTVLLVVILIQVGNRV